MFDGEEYNNFLYDPVVQDESKDKRFRTLYICKSLNLNKLIKKCVTEVAENCGDHLKSEKNASFDLDKAKWKYDPEREDNFKEIIKILTNAILYAPFGEKVFNEAHTLRAKCNLKLSKYSNALYDVNTAIKYGGLCFERILLKSIALYSMSKYSELKEFLLDDKVSKVAVEKNVENETARLGFDFLTMEYLRHFALNECFDEKLSYETNAEEPNRKLLKEVVNFQKAYTMDKVEVVSDSYKGRYMKAKEFIATGTTVLVERSFSISYSQATRHEFCLCCNARCLEQYIPCKYCIDVIFCNEDCFQKAWNLFHQHDCLLSPFLDYLSDHMYRSMSRVGMWNAIKVHEKIKRLRADPEIVDQAIAKGQTVSRVVNDKIIDEFLFDESLRNGSVLEFTEEQKIKTYEMQCTLLDHNETFEGYYDASYMPVALNVALLLMLNEYLRSQTDSPVKFSQIDMQEIRSMLKENETREELEDYKIFGFSIEVFIKLVEVIQLNIRKLATNVFSWKHFENYVAKSYIASCQVLIGSFINHSCDPNVEWDFKNGCISYTALRDIQPGEEVNNSYGPHTGTPFLDRQKKMAKNYYFNCYCPACQGDVNNYRNVLLCLACSGPVVVIPDSYIPATCMICHRSYNDAPDRMLRVNEHRANFKQLLRYFFQPTVLFRRQPLRNEKFQKFLAKLTEAIDYQLTYVYTDNRKLQRDLMMYCLLLVKIGKLSKAAFYGQQAFNESLPELYVHNEPSIESSWRELRISSFYYDLYKKFVNNFNQLPEDTKKIHDENASLYTASVQLIDHFKATSVEALEKLQGRSAKNPHDPKSKRLLEAINLAKFLFPVINQ